MKLLNRSEELTFDVIQEAIRRADAHVFSKVRIADAVKLTGSGIPDHIFEYGLKAHFDFVITDGDYETKFAVEFDGPLHKTSEIQKARDQKKNFICEHLKFPLLRINSNYIDRDYGGLKLLEYFIEVWFLSEAFHDAQEKGQIPPDEPFDPCFAMVPLDGGSYEFRYWLSRTAQIEMQNLFKNNRLYNYVPGHWTGEDKGGVIRTLAWLEVTKGSYVVTRTAMQQQLFPAYFDDVLFQIAVLDLRRMVDFFLQNKVEIVHEAKLKTLVEEYEKNFTLLGCGGSGRFLPLPNSIRRST